MNFKFDSNNIIKLDKYINMKILQILSLCLRSVRSITLMGQGYPDKYLKYILNYSYTKFTFNDCISECQ
jgi:hypothetical protein